MAMTTLKKALQFVEEHLIKSPDLSRHPLIVGISGPQGSGKTYLSDKLTDELKRLHPHLHIVGFSIDDFYLSYEDQCNVNTRELQKGEKKGNPLLIGRGLPGTHDLSLLNEIMGKISQRAVSYRIPRYNKSLHKGKGDRETQDKWYDVGSKPIDIAVCEGWFNGYVSEANECVLRNNWEKIQSKKINTLFERVSGENIVQINQQLKKYEDVWSFFGLFIYLTTNDISNVYKWRLEQEHDLISVKGTGMKDEDVVKFVDRYMPMYHLFYHRLEKNGLQLGLGERKVDNLQLKIDLSRELISCHHL